MHTAVARLSSKMADPKIRLRNCISSIGSVSSRLEEERAGSSLVNVFFGVFATMPHHCAVPGCASNSRTVVSMSIQLTQIFVVRGVRTNIRRVSARELGQSIDVLVCEVCTSQKSPAARQEERGNV